MLEIWDPPLNYCGNSDHSKKFTLVGILSGKGEWLWEPNVPVTAMNKIDCQLHFCVFCCFLKNCQSQWDEHFNKNGFHPAFKKSKENQWNV